MQETQSEYRTIWYPIRNIEFENTTDIIQLRDGLNTISEQIPSSYLIYRWFYRDYYSGGSRYIIDKPNENMNIESARLIPKPSDTPITIALNFDYKKEIDAQLNSQLFKVSFSNIRDLSNILTTYHAKPIEYHFSHRINNDIHIRCNHPTKREYKSQIMIGLYDKQTDVKQFIMNRIDMFIFEKRYVIHNYIYRLFPQIAKKEKIGNDIFCLRSIDKNTFYVATGELIGICYDDKKQKCMNTKIFAIRLDKHNKYHIFPVLWKNVLANVSNNGLLQHLQSIDVESPSKFTYNDLVNINKSFKKTKKGKALTDAEYYGSNYDLFKNTNYKFNDKSLKNAI